MNKYIALYQGSWLLLMLAMVAGLEGPDGSICTKQNAKQETITSTQTYQCNEAYQKKCNDWFWDRSMCTKYRYKICSRTVQGTKTTYYTTAKCCYGWKTVNEICTPFCIHSCTGGDCTGPNECTCYKGYYGYACEHKVQCPYISSPQNGQLSIQSGYYGDVSIASCNHGYSLEGDTRRTCREDSTWSGSPIKCTRISCAAVPQPLNGFSSSVHGRYGDKISMHCKAGYKLVSGSSVRECEASGTWSGTDAVCQEVNECESNPCRNSGNCQDQSNGYVCLCKAGFTGSHCHVDVDECQSNPCQNGGACLDGNSGYQCSCKTGFTAKHCESVINQCSSNPCVNGKCVNKNGGFICECSLGFTGMLCEQETDECHSWPCRNGGSCVDGVNSYSCKCRNGFKGTWCEQKMCCGNVPTVINGEIRSVKGTTCYGGVVEYGCKRGYRLKSSSYSNVNCGQNGWSQPLPKCLRDPTCSITDLAEPSGGGMKVCSSSDDGNEYCLMKCSEPSLYLPSPASLKTNGLDVFVCGDATNYKWRVKAGQDLLPANVVACSVSTGKVPFVQFSAIVEASNTDFLNSTGLDSIFLEAVQNWTLCLGGTGNYCQIVDVKETRYQQRVVYQLGFKVETISVQGLDSPTNTQLVQNAMKRGSEVIKNIKRHVSALNVTLNQTHTVTVDVKLITASNPLPICGEYLVMREDECYECAPGSYHDLTNGQCKLCPLDSYQSLAGKSKCLSCPRGHQTERIGASSSHECKKLEPCAPGTVLFKDKCFEFSNSTTSYYEADAYCSAHHGLLAIVNDKETHKFLTSTLHAGVNASNWIGLDDIYQEGSFLYSDGSHLGTHVEWSRDCPTRLVNNDRDCVVMDSDYNYLWKDYPCNQKFHFVCQYETSTYVKSDNT